MRGVQTTDHSNEFTEKRRGTSFLNSSKRNDAAETDLVRRLPDKVRLAGGNLWLGFSARVQIRAVGFLAMTESTSQALVASVNLVVAQNHAKSAAVGHFKSIVTDYAMGGCAGEMPTGLNYRPETVSNTLSRDRLSDHSSGRRLWTFRHLAGTG